MSKRESRPFAAVAVDGEGVTRADGSHDYTLLLAHNPIAYPDHLDGKSSYIQKWERGGLSTRRIFHYLCHLHFSPRGREWRGTTVAFYFNYDVTKWLRDLSEDQRATLWGAGWVVWRDHLTPAAPWYYVRYIPSKLFFIGECEPESLDPHHVPEMWKWEAPHRLIFDVSGFEQRAFVKAMGAWDVPLAPDVEEMKKRRGDFTPDEQQRIREYCRDECRALSAYVAKLNGVLLEEEMRLTSWHGAGAISSVMLKQHNVASVIRDPADSPELTDAMMRAYFGGRNEICRMGVLRDVYDYDVNSAYPAAAATLPDLVHGHWERHDYTNPTIQTALVRVAWRCLDGERVGPLPYRYRSGVYFPSSGEGWYHLHEVEAAMRAQPGTRWSVLGAWCWIPDRDAVLLPLDWVRAYAERRVRYKTTDPKRATIYKYGLNSLYGKFAQHTSDPDRPPPFQSYLAAGYITAYTRAQLLDFVYTNTHDGGDVVMFATDGVFCTQPRAGSLLSDTLGGFSLSGVLDEGVFIQPGCWFGSDGETRSRGFGRKSLDYATVREEWDRRGAEGSVGFTERRFVGLGQCAGTGNWESYGRWVEQERTLSFYPERKFVRDMRRGGARELPEWYALAPFDMGDAGLSEAFVPQTGRDETLATEALAEMLERWRAEDQPDLP